MGDAERPPTKPCDDTGNQTRTTVARDHSGEERERIHLDSANIYCFVFSCCCFCMTKNCQLYGETALTETGTESNKKEKCTPTNLPTVYLFCFQRFSKAHAQLIKQQWYFKHKR